jgi:hypothetical protein
MDRKLKGFHYLRRTADQRLGRLHRLQTSARYGNEEAWNILARVGVDPFDSMYVKRRGLWDRRYEVFVREKA